MKDRLSTLQLFCRVARTGSFTAAGKEMGKSQPSVSRTISGLEAELGVALFVRSTHAMSLTEAGEFYLERIEPLLSAIQEANDRVRGDGTLKGKLRISCPASFAIREVIPRLPGFLEENPALKIDFVLSDARQNLIDHGIDIAIRFGVLEDSTMVARKLVTGRRLLAASPAYLSKAGTPGSPAELAAHSIVRGPSGKGPLGWKFEKGGTQLSVQVDGQVSVDVNEASTAAALAGLGIITTATFGCRKELESGELVQILPDWEIGTIEGHAILAAGRKAKSSARTFVDYLTQSFREGEGV